MIEFYVHHIPGASAHCSAIIDVLKEAGTYPPAYNPEGEGDAWIAKYICNVNFAGSAKDVFIRADTTDDGTIIAHRKILSDNKIMAYAWVGYGTGDPEDCYLLTAIQTIPQGGYNADARIPVIKR